MKKLLSIIIAVVTAAVMTLAFTACEKEPNKYTVIYDANGGAVEVESFIYTEGETFELAVPTFAGYTFDGWYVEDVLFTTESKIESDLVLVAKWTANSYKINYTFDGEAYGSDDVTFNEAYTVKAAPSVATGYHFGGWKKGSAAFTAGTYTTVGDTEVSGVSVLNTANVTFEVFNSANDVELVEGMTGVVLSTGDDLPECELVVNGKNGVVYEFVGWTLSSSDNGDAPVILTTVCIENDGADLVFKAVYKAARI